VIRGVTGSWKMKPDRNVSELPARIQAFCSQRRGSSSQELVTPYCLRFTYQSLSND
jgi:hypothetical protein